MVFSVVADGGGAPGAAAGLRGSRRGPCTGGVPTVPSREQASGGTLLWPVPWVLLGSGPEGPPLARRRGGGRGVAGGGHGTAGQ